MKLSRFDGCRVRVTTERGEVFEGVCAYQNAEYNEHEFGCAQEGLSFPYLLLYKSEIRRVELLENGYSAPFGKLEELAVEDGVIGIEEVLFCEEEESVLRLLAYLKSRLGYDLPCLPEALASVRKLMGETQSDSVRAAAARLLHASKEAEEHKNG